MVAHDGQRREEDELTVELQRVVNQHVMTYAPVSVILAGGGGGGGSCRGVLISG